MRNAYVLGIPHTQANLKFTTCAYTVKAINLCKMLKMLKYHVTFIGAAGSDTCADKTIDVASADDFEKFCGHPKTDFYDIRTDGDRKEYHEKYDQKTREFFRQTTMKAEPWSEIICCPWGWGNNEQIKDVNNQYIIESGIGYDNTFSQYRAFESYAWLHFHMGKENRSGGNCWKECVIPNAFDMDMFECSDIPINKREYFLYFGRLIDAKGVRLAVEIAKAMNKKIMIVGQGDPMPYLKMYDKVEYHRPVGVEKRREIMGGAIALICPTYYIEPFGGVAVEAQLSGTPVISTDWGAFTETVVHGLTGFRCKTFDQFVRAADLVQMITPRTCRNWACRNYSLEKVSKMYGEYFDQVLDYNKDGFYQRHPEKDDLDFMKVHQALRCAP